MICFIVAQNICMLCFDMMSRCLHQATDCQSLQMQLHLKLQKRICGKLTKLFTSRLEPQDVGLTLSRAIPGLNNVKYWRLINMRGQE